MTNTPEFDDTTGPGSADTNRAATGTLPPPPPVPVQPARKSGRGWTIFFGIIAAAMLGLVIAVIGLFAAGAAFVAAVASGDIEIETDTVAIDLAPASVEAIPSSIEEEAADIEIDLTNIDIAEFQNEQTPVELDVKADYGSITVIVPENLNVSVDASSDLGDIVVFDDSDDGIDNTLIRVNDDPDAILELDLNVGKIEVVRG